MVFQNRPYLAEVRVCNISLQRHETSTVALRQQQKQLLGRRLKSRANFNVGGNRSINRMQTPQHEQQRQQQQQQQPLPLVELSPFRKSVWRREKSLPDFYERRQGLNSQQQQRDGDSKKHAPNSLFRAASNGKDKQNPQQVDLTTTEMAARLAAAVNAPDGDFGVQGEEQAINGHHPNSSKKRGCQHPKAEFQHESTKLWRTQDLIPGFITRLERTKTSMLSFYRDNSNCAGDVSFYLGEDNGSSFIDSSSGDSSEFSSNGGNMKIRGGRMKQNVQRRPLLYLNPLDSYRQAPDGVRDHVHPWADYSLSHSKLATRNSFPLTSSRARELMLSGAAHATYPLRPVRHHGVKGHQQHQHTTDAFYAPPACNSPHKFNSKLGAAKNSLEVLSSLGTPTKLEKSLVAEYEMNLERFRRDRLMVQPFDLRSVPSQYVPATMNLTRGELCLQEAREANRARRRKNLLTPLGGTSSSASSQLVNTDRGSLTSEGGDGTGTAVSALKKQQYSFVDPAMHPLDSVLAEESESHVLTDDDLSSASAVNAAHVKPTTKSAPGKMVKIADGELHKDNENLVYASTSSCVGKIQHEDSQNDVCKDSTVSARSRFASKKDPSKERDMDIDLTHDDDGETICMQDTTTPVSVGGSSTSRAKTNLEYLNKLRTKGAPRPLQPLHHTPLEKDVKSDLSLQASGNITVDTHSTDNPNVRIASEKNSDNVDSTNDGVVSENTKIVITGQQSMKDLSVTQATISESDGGALNGNVSSADKHISPQEKDDDRSPPASQVTTLDPNISTTQEIISHNEEIQISSRGNKTKNTSLEVEACQEQKISSPPGHGTPSEDEGFASPKQIVSPKELESQIPSLITDTVHTESRDHNSNNDRRQQPVSDRSGAEPNTSVEYEGEATPTIPPLLSARGDVRDEVTSMTPLGTPFTRGDSATLVGTPLTNLDTSLEPFSETEGVHSTSADNGDSGVSTTFLTTEDSRAEILEGVVFS